MPLHPPSHPARTLILVIGSDKGRPWAQKHFKSRILQTHLCSLISGMSGIISLELFGTQKGGGDFSCRVFTLFLLSAVSSPLEEWILGWYSLKFYYFGELN